MTAPVRLASEEKAEVERRFDAACRRLRAANDELMAAEREYGHARAEFDEWFADQISEHV